MARRTAWSQWAHFRAAEAAITRKISCLAGLNENQLQPLVLPQLSHT